MVAILADTGLSEKAEPKSRWYRVDNAGKIFSAVTTKRLTTLFRLSCTLKEAVCVDTLQRILPRVMTRFPYFAVQLRPGMFWYYFDQNLGEPKAVADSVFPCMGFAFKRRGQFPFRVRLYHKRIALEVAHALTDGTGATALLRAIVAAYLMDRYKVEFEDTLDLMLPGQPVDPEESEDGFHRYFDPDIPEPVQEPRAFHLSAPLDPPGVYRVTTGIIPTGDILRLSKAIGVSLGEYLTGVYIFAFYQILQGYSRSRRKELARPIRLDIPVNLRTRFPSKTMRNFFLPVLPSIDPRLGTYTLEETIMKVHHFMRVEVDQKYLRQQLARNVKAEIHPFLRIFPLFAKEWVLSAAYDLIAQGRTTSGLSNLGRISMPDALVPYIERFDFLPAPATSRKIGCGVISFGDQLVITFGRITPDASVEREFFRLLTCQGTRVRLETNTTIF